MSDLGSALTGEFEIGGAIAKLFDKGATIQRDGKMATVIFDFPLIGRPHIAAATPTGISALPVGAVGFNQNDWDVEVLKPIVNALCADRIALSQTAAPGSIVPLAFDYAGTSLNIFFERARHHLSCQGAATSHVLYDVAVRGDNGWVVVAPHAVYYRDDWTDCGIVHITDLHLARRIDGFRDKLLAKGKTEAADRLYNFNDRFRGFVRYANYLHDAGLLDAVVATGDIIDYIFEKDDDHAGNGNADFARDIILGRSGSSTSGAVEELRVPIFMTGGNHDYRSNPYPLFFKLDLGFDAKTIKNYGAYNIDQSAAMVISPGNADDGIARFGTDSAKAFVAVDKDNRPFHALVHQSSYVVHLGNHRLVMIDSEWDVGIVDDLSEGIGYLLGLGSEDNNTFVGGSPNSEGVSDRELKLLTDALDEAPVDGVVIVGIHAPLLNPQDNAYQFYLRETQRPVQGQFVASFLTWHFTLGSGGQAHESWYDKSGNGQPSYVKRGDNSDLLDYGVSRGKAYETLRACAGIGVGRAADVVLEGHVHHHNEFRVGIVGDDLAYYFDFYTSNPMNYYCSKFAYDISSIENTYVSVEEGAPASGRPFEMPIKAAAQKYVVKVPPYADPLDKAADKQAWWNKHRPLIVQTAALGPFDTPEADFCGFRLISIKNNRIDTMQFCSINVLHGFNYVCPWEQAIGLPAPSAYRHRQRTFDGGGEKCAGEPFGFVAPINQAQNIIYRTADNDISEAWRLGGQTGFGVISGSAPKAAGNANPFVYVNPNKKNQIVLYRADDGSVHSLYYDQGAVSHDELSRGASAPAAASDPIGTYDPKTDLHHVFYRKADGRIHELWWLGDNVVAGGDLTGDFPKAKGGISGIVETSTGTNVVVYRGTDDQIHSLYWVSRPVGHDSLSLAVGAPAAAGDPAALYLAQDNSTQVYYRASNGHIIELYWANGSAVNTRDLTALTGTPAAGGDPFVYRVAMSGKTHLVYRSTQGKVIGMWWETRTPGQTYHVDMTDEAVAPLAQSDVHAFFAGAQNFVIYRDKDGFIHEIGSTDWTIRSDPVSVSVNTASKSRGGGFGFHRG